MLSGNETEGFKILNDIAHGKNIGSKLDSSIGELFGSDSLPTSASQSGIGDYSWAQIGQMNYRKQTRGLAEQFFKDMSNCQQHLQNALNQILTVFSQTYPKLAKIALSQSDEYFQNTDVNTVIQDFLISGNKILKLNDSEISSDKQAMMQYIARLNSIVQAIPQLKTAKIRGKYYTSSHSAGKFNINTRSQLISVLLGKVGGILSSLSGSVEEIAVGRGLEQAILKGNQEIINTSAKFTGGLVSLDPKLKSDSVPLEDYTFNKNDVIMSVVGNKVSCTFGVSVKITNAVNIKIHSEANLNTVLSTLKKEGIDDYYIYNLAGGLDKEYQGSISLQKAWRSMVDYAVTINFLDYLAGNGSLNNNNLILIANRKIYSIQKILMGVTSNPDAIIYTGGKQRSRYWQINDKNYIETTDDKKIIAAEQRSNTTWNEIHQAFINTKMTISLNLAAALT